MASNTTPFRFAHAFATDWTKSVAQIVAQLDAAAASAQPSGDTEDVGLLFINSMQNRHAQHILDALRAQTGIQQWFGGASRGVLAGRSEYWDDPGIAVMIGSFPKGSVRLFTQFTPLPPIDEASGDTPWWTGLVLGCAARVDIKTRLHEMAGSVGSGFVFGALTGLQPDRRPMPTFVGTGADMGNGLAGLAFRTDIGRQIHVRMASAYKTLGPAHQITEAHDNVVSKLDGRAAQDVLNDEYIMPQEGERDDLVHYALTRPSELVNIGIYDCIRVALGRGQQTGGMGHLTDYELTCIDDIDATTGKICLRVEDPVPRGARVRFCLHDGQSARKELQEMLDALRDDMRERGLTVRGGLYFSSAERRHPSFFGEESGHELDWIHDTLAPLGEFPLVGLYSENEIMHDFRHLKSGQLVLFTD